MITRIIQNLTATLALFLASACAFDGADPLLYDDEGHLRQVVDAEEVESAGISESCAGVSLEAFGDPVRVPIEGGLGAELVGVGGFALCIDQDDPDLDGLQVGEEEGLDDDHAANLALLSETMSSSNSASSTQELCSDTQKQGDNPDGNLNGNHSLIFTYDDPTPEPSGD